MTGKFPDKIELHVCDDLSDDFGFRGFIVAITDRYVIVADTTEDCVTGQVRRVHKHEAFACRGHWIAAHPEEVAGE
jgi:hypothetical protein